MKIVNNNGTITIDCENTAVVYLEKGEECIKLEGFDDKVKFGGYSNCIFLSKRDGEKYTFGQTITVSGKNYRYIGIDDSSTNGRLLLFDEERGRMLLGE